MEMTPQRWTNTTRYLREVYGEAPGDEQLRTLMERAVADGLPDIAVSGDVGRILRLLSATATGGTDSRGLVIEVGTLAGYSGLWIARGLADGARLVTIEKEPRHAAFARVEFDAAGVGGRVKIEVGAALDVLPRLAERLGQGAVDMVFLDAVKTEYGAYLELAAPMLRRGGLLAVDNALGGRWWIDDPAGSSPDRDAMDRFNRALGSDARFDSACVPSREGVAIARKR